MAGRKVSREEADRIIASVLQYVLDNPGARRFEVFDFHNTAPTDVVARGILRLARDGKIAIDETAGKGPTAKLYPVSLIENSPLAEEILGGMSGRIDQV